MTDEQNSSILEMTRGASDASFGLGSGSRSKNNKQQGAGKAHLHNGKANVGQYNSNTTM
jgi:hypothetical protein